MKRRIKSEKIQALKTVFLNEGMKKTPALKLARLNVRLEEKLANGTATFTYVKSDGSVRVAVGTNKPTIVPNYYTFVGDSRQNTDTLRYFDLEKAAFRCFTKRNLVSIAAA